MSRNNRSKARRAYPDPSAPPRRDCRSDRRRNVPLDLAGIRLPGFMQAPIETLNPKPRQAIGADNLADFSDRYAQALLYQKLARDCFAEALRLPGVYPSQ